MSNSRNTKQKSAIRDVLHEVSRPLTAQEIEKLAAKIVPGIGIATVYRAIKRLQEDREIAVVEIAGKAPLYELTDKGHHHHFVCNECGRVFDIEDRGENLDKMAPKGFQVDKHEITFFGKCDRCD
ncbi:MAG: transcriptional repressor [Verrucomicrobiota bacterium]